MKSSFSYVLWSVVLVLPMWLACAGTYSGAAESSEIAIPSGLLRHPALKDVEPALLRISSIDLNVLRTSATRVEVLDRIPVRELVLVDSRGAWELLLTDKSLATGWRAITEAKLHRVRDLGCSIDASGLAQELARLLVDPDPRYGIVISSAEDIPTNYSSSDLLRDLERQGHEPASVQSALLRRAPRTIAPPRLTCVRGTAQIEYYTWHYFGGEVAQWIVRLGPSQAAIKYKSLAAGVGSYDYYH